MGLDPDEYDGPSMKRTSYLTKALDWSFGSEPNRESTTYTHGGQMKDLSILHVCRTIYQEASTVFYSQNTFYFVGYDQVIPFLKVSL